MEIPLYQVDAFTSQVFRGNPAAVCPLMKWLDDDVMQAIAAENNLAETAFFTPEGKGFGIRWFTPMAEIDLCGHATLAAAFVLFAELGYDDPVIRFESASGPLLVEYTASGRLMMDFPVWRPEPTAPTAALMKALGGPTPAEVLAHRDWLIVYEDEAAVRALTPNLDALADPKTLADRMGVIVTAPGPDNDEDADIDFVSRFFAPSMGVPEDPVTGSAHCQLAPYWAARLGKVRMQARQVSPRGGELYCSMDATRSEMEDEALHNGAANGERLRLSGDAVLYFRGSCFI